MQEVRKWVNEERTVDGLTARKLVRAILGESPETGACAKTCGQNLHVREEAAAEYDWVARIHGDGLVAVPPHNVIQFGADVGRGLIPTHLRKIAPLFAARVAALERIVEPVRILVHT
jgi:hypothetical protein